MLLIKKYKTVSSMEEFRILYLMLLPHVKNGILSTFGWKEIEGKEGKDLEGCGIPCLDNKMGVK